MKNQTTYVRIRNVASFVLSFALLTFPSQVHALDGTDFPPMEAFIAQVMNGDADELRGMYIPGVLADVIVSQPQDNSTFVSSEPDTLTQFELASRYGAIGLLAHNYLAGNDFFLLEEGQLLYLIYGDGSIEIYIITEFMRYKAVRPHSINSDFVDLQTGELFSASRLFLKAFHRQGDVVLQTCIYADGDASWGRLFIVAEPYEEYAPISMPHRMVFQ